MVSGIRDVTGMDENSVLGTLLYLRVGLLGKVVTGEFEITF